MNMGIRDYLNRNPRLTASIFGTLTVLAVAFAAYQVLAGNGPSGGAASGLQSFYSTDDGKTYFTDDSRKLPPFKVDAGEAVKAYVYSCDGGKTTFVGYLERYSPKALAAMEAAKAKATDPTEVNVTGILESAVEYKAVGGTEWVTRSATAKIARIFDVKCPGNTGGTAQPVTP